MKLNNKGFSLIEIIAVIVVLGILLSLAAAEYNKFYKQSRDKAYDYLAQAASDAAEEYAMEHMNVDSVNFDVLVEEGFLENAIDPGDDNNNCVGTVNITKVKATDNIGLDTNDYSVSICCDKYNYTYRYPGGNKVEDKDGCKANENIRKYIETQPEVNCLSSETKTVTYNIYTMDYIDKTCELGSNGRYGTCYDSGTPTKRVNLPCRRYTYHQRSCSCTYSKNTNKFCSSSVKATGDDHTMKVKYQDNSEGIAACKSDEPGSINSYIDHVCYWGQFSGTNTVMTFHGYQFFKGKSVGYTDFSPNGSWFHDGGYYDDRVPRGADIDGKPNYEDGCRNTCIHFTEKWMGTIK